MRRLSKRVQKTLGTARANGSSDLERRCKAAGRNNHELESASSYSCCVSRPYLEPELEKHFHPDSYGYRLGKSALEAVGVARQRCWRHAWVLDLDIRAYFDSIPHELLLRAVRRHLKSLSHSFTLACETCFLFLVHPVQLASGCKRV